MAITFKDNTAKVEEKISSVIKGFLYEAAGELQSQTQRNSRVDTGQTKGSYKYKVELGKNEGTAYIGSDDKNAIWEEYGTGEYALNGDGRKGYWVFVKGGSGGGTKSAGKNYTLEEAKQVMAILRSKGLDAYYTKGKTANRPLFKAFTVSEPKLQSRLEQVLKNLS